MDEREEFNLGLYYTFFVAHRGEVYCIKIIPFSAALKYVDGDWVEVPYDSAYEEYRQIKNEEIYESFNGVKAVRKLREIDARISEESDNRILEIAKRRNRKVIGWAYYPYSGRLLPSSEDDDEPYAAFVQDVIDHGYFLSGEAYQNLDMFPVLDDYTYGDFSRRGFGALIALSRGDHGSFAYAKYTDEREPWDDAVIPAKGLYPELKLANKDPIEVDEKVILDLEELKEKTKNSISPIYLFPVKIPEGKYYFIDEKITLVSKTNGRKIETPLQLVQMHGADVPMDACLDEEKWEIYFAENDLWQKEDHLVLGVDPSLL